MTCSAARLTTALLTPVVFCSFRSIVAAQFAQVIPHTGMMIFESATVLNPFYLSLYCGTRSESKQIRKRNLVFQKARLLEKSNLSNRALKLRNSSIFILTFWI